MKEASCTRQYQNTVREGDTYQNDIGLWHSSDIQEIPAPIAAPQNENLMSIDSTPKIMFDVEATSLVLDLVKYLLLIIYKPYQPQDDHRHISPRNIVMSLEVSFPLRTWCCCH